MFRILRSMLIYSKFYLKKLLQLQVFIFFLFVLVIISIIVLLPNEIQREFVILSWNTNAESWFISKPNMTEIIKPNETTCIHCVNIPDVCKSNSPPLDVFYFVASHPRNYLKRQAIRDTWGSDQLLSLKPVFMVAISSDSSVFMEYVKTEATSFGDMIIENFHDTYNNLTIKTGFMLKHFLDLCPNAKYMMKTDDDTFVNTKYINHILTNYSKLEPALLGQTFEYALTTRDPHSKWYMSVSTYNSYYLPKYLSGSGYLISGKVIPALLKASLEEPIIRLEDVYFTGILANKLGLEREHVIDFFCDSIFCSPSKYATIHKMQVADFYRFKL